MGFVKRLLTEEERKAKELDDKFEGMEDGYYICRCPIELDDGDSFTADTVFYVSKEYHIDDGGGCIHCTDKDGNDCYIYADDPDILQFEKTDAIKRLEDALYDEEEKDKTIKDMLGQFDRKYPLSSRASDSEDLVPGMIGGGFAVLFLGSIFWISGVEVGFRIGELLGLIALAGGLLAGVAGLILRGFVKRFDLKRDELKDRIKEIVKHHNETVREYIWSFDSAGSAPDISKDICCPFGTVTGKSTGKREEFNGLYLWHTKKD